jgi:phosphopantetheinyl transferase
MNILPVPAEWHRTLRIVTDVTDEDRTRMLTIPEQERVRSFPRERRQAEWSASRIAAKLLALDLGLCSDPRACAIVSSYRKPALAIEGLNGKWHVSISHSSGAGAAGLDPGPIGIDIQQPRQLNPRITKFYLQDEELDQLLGVAVAHPLIHFWCAKEAAFKLKAGPGWLKRVAIELKGETADGLTFALSYPVTGVVHTFGVGEQMIAAVARQLKP